MSLGSSRQSYDIYTGSSSDTYVTLAVSGTSKVEAAVYVDGKGGYHGDGTLWSDGTFSFSCSGPGDDVKVDGKVDSEGRSFDVSLSGEESGSVSGSYQTGSSDNYFETYYDGKLAMDGVDWKLDVQVGTEGNIYGKLTDVSVDPHVIYDLDGSVDPSGYTQFHVDKGPGSFDFAGAFYKDGSTLKAGGTWKSAFPGMTDTKGTWRMTKK